MSYKKYYKSPIGTIEICGDDRGVSRVEFCECPDADNFPKGVTFPIEIVECEKQLDEYFKGERKEFSVKLFIEKGTDFQKKVWKALTEVPYGETVSYGHIAKAIQNSKAVRAVGNANNKNPISIIIPCHRIIGSSGKLVGYGGGLWRKKWLLDHEQEFINLN